MSCVWPVNTFHLHIAAFSILVQANKNKLIILRISNPVIISNNLFCFPRKWKKTWPYRLFLVKTPSRYLLSGNSSWGLHMNVPLMDNNSGDYFLKPLKFTLLFIKYDLQVVFVCPVTEKWTIIYHSSDFQLFIFIGFTVISSSECSYQVHYRCDI